MSAVPETAPDYIAEIHAVLIAAMGKELSAPLRAALTALDLQHGYGPACECGEEDVCALVLRANAADAEAARLSALLREAHAAAAKADARLYRALDALGGMYCQYTPGMNGHDFMSAGEDAQDVLNDEGLLNADWDFIGMPLPATPTCPSTCTGCEKGDGQKPTYPNSVFATEAEHDASVADVVRRIQSGEVQMREPDVDEEEDPGFRAQSEYADTLVAEEGPCCDAPTIRLNPAIPPETLAKAERAVAKVMAERPGGSLPSGGEAGPKPTAKDLVVGSYWRHKKKGHEVLISSRPGPFGLTYKKSGIFPGHRDFNRPIAKQNHYFLGEYEPVTAAAPTTIEEKGGPQNG